MAKQTLEVRVAGKNYTLVSSDPPEYVRRVAEYVDRRLSETDAVTNLPFVNVATLTCFNLADELIKAKDELTKLKRRLEESGK